MISTSALPGILKPDIPYTSKRVKEFNARQNYNRLHKKNPEVQNKLIDRKIIPINTPINDMETNVKG